MAITTLDQLAAANTTASCQRPQVSKAGMTLLTAGQQGSFWRSAGNPAAAAIPATAATCNNTTAGGMNYTLPISGQSTYISKLQLLASVACSVEIHDRLAHVGGGSGSTTTAQTVGIDLSTMTTDNLAARVGGDYSKVQWWVEIYTTTGAAAQSATIAYTNQSGTAKSTTVAMPANAPAGLIVPIIPLVGDSIRGVVSITYGSALVTSGNYGITATIEKTSIALPQPNALFTADWEALSLPPIIDSSCLFMIGDTATTAVLGTLAGSVSLVQG